MRPVLILLVLILTIPVFAEPMCDNIANYNINAKLNTTDKSVTGQLVLEWTNSTDHPVSDLWFHAYLNAFRNTSSTFLKGVSVNQMPLFGPAWPENGWGYLDIHALTINMPATDSYVDLLASLQYMHPDDNNDADRTVFKVDLPAPVTPGQTVNIHIDFTAKLPYKGIRAGFKDEFYLVSQWFPKIGVLTNDGWTCNQYHITTEFFSDFGVYNVSVTVPAGYIIGSTGVLTDSVAAKDGIIYNFTQDCVHDFAFTASPDFRVITDTIERQGSGPIQVRLLYMPEHEKFVARYLDAARHALLHFSDWYLPYPYPQVTIVDVPHGTRVASMEYPTFITVSNSLSDPAGAMYPEWCVIHELGHQWWYGLVASNEAEHAWLDEGLTSYADVRCMNASYGHVAYGQTWLTRPGFAIPFTFNAIQFQPVARRIDRLRHAPVHQPVDQPAWQFMNYKVYKAHSYDKAALLMMTLENMLGAETFSAILKEYALRYQYQHPGPQDFINLVNEMSPQPVNDIMEQVLHGHGILDYAVQDVQSEPVPVARGLNDSGKLLTPAKAKGADMRYQSDITIQRNGSLVIPVDILVEFENGDTETMTWDGRETYRSLHMLTDSPVLKVTVDPEQKIALDMDPSNNVRYRRKTVFPAVNWSVRWLFWFQHLLETTASFS